MSHEQRDRAAASGNGARQLAKMLGAGAIIWSIAGGTVHALPLTFVRAGALASVDFGPTQNNDSGIVPGPSTSEDASAVGRSDSGSSTLGDSGAVASRGKLGAKAEVESALAVGPDERAEATAGAIASFADRVTFHAPASGSTVTVRFVLHLEGTVDDVCGIGACRLDATGSLDDLGRGGGRIMPQAQVVFDSGDPAAAILPPQTVAQELTFSDGAVLDLENVLDVSASANGVAGAGADAITGNFLATETFGIDVLTPGGSYSTASGVSYSGPTPSAIPEPSTLLMTLGLPALLVGWRRSSGGAKRRRWGYRP